MAPPDLAFHQHGKSRVRVARVWREGAVHHFAEWTVNTMLESAMEHSYLTVGGELCVRACVRAHVLLDEQPGSACKRASPAMCVPPTLPFAG